MVVGPDNSKPPDSDSDPAEESDAELSPRAREVKRQLEAGTYEVDVEALANTLLDEEVLDLGSAEGEAPASDKAQNDQKARTK